MNRKVIIGTLIGVAFVLLIFVSKMRDSSAEKAESQQTVTTAAAKTGAEGVTAAAPQPEPKALTEDEALARLKGYWIVSAGSNLSADPSDYQLLIKEVANSDLKNGHKLQGYLFSNAKDRIVTQTLGLLEPVGIEGNSYTFDVKKADVDKFYTEGSYDPEEALSKITLNIGPNSVEASFLDTQGTRKGGNLEKVDLAMLNEFKVKMSAVRAEDKAQFNLDLSKISDFELDAGSVSLKSEDCKGQTMVKIRPLTQKLILVSSGAAYCTNTMTMKEATILMPMISILTNI